MLSKLLANINASNKASGDNAVGSTGDGREMDSSEQIFKSLLQSLQSEGESEKAKQKLLALSSESSEQQESVDGNSEQLNVLGGSFTMMGEETIEDLEQVDQNIMKELQKEFQNIKNELIANAENDSSSDDTTDENKEAADNDGQKSGKQVIIGESDALQTDTAVDEENDHSESENTESKIRNQSNGNAEQVQKGQVRSEGESDKNSEGKNVSGRSDQSAASKIVEGQDSEETGAKTEGKSKENSDKAVPVGHDEKDESSPSKTNETEKTNSSAKQKVSSSFPNEIAPKLQGEQVNAESSEESKNKNSEKGKPGLRILNDDNQTVRVEKTSGLSKKDIRSDAFRQPADGNINVENSGSADRTQTASQMDETRTAKGELNDQQKKVMSSFFKRDNSANISSKGLEMRGAQNSKEKKSSKNNADSESRKADFGKQPSDGRDKILSRLGLSSSKAQKELKPLNLQNFSGISMSDTNGNLEDKKLDWEEQVTKTLETSSEKESKGGSSGTGSMRLGQMPVTNASLKKKILPGLTQNIQKAASSAQKGSGDWQKHSFTLDDGKNVQLSIRETKGVLQVKVGSMNLDLSKLLQQNLQQIREHLKQEFGSDIDLQFDNQQSGEESQFSENTEQSSRKRNYKNNFAGEGVAAENTDTEHTKMVRNFGYNQMEWTA